MVKKDFQYLNHELVSQCFLGSYSVEFDVQNI